jgi:hypothetical protein
MDLKYKVIVYNTQVNLYVLYMCKTYPKFEDEIYLKFFRPKWSFIESVPALR